jgi:hypothetical protein
VKGRIENGQMGLERERERERRGFDESSFLRKPKGQHLTFSVRVLIRSDKKMGFYFSFVSKERNAEVHRILLFLFL